VLSDEFECKKKGIDEERYDRKDRYDMLIELSVKLKNESEKSKRRLCFLCPAKTLGDYESHAAIKK